MSCYIFLVTDTNWVHALWHTLELHIPFYFKSHLNKLKFRWSFLIEAVNFLKVLLTSLSEIQPNLINHSIIIGWRRFKLVQGSHPLPREDNKRMKNMGWDVFRIPQDQQKSIISNSKIKQFIYNYRQIYQWKNISLH